MRNLKLLGVVVLIIIGFTYWGVQGSVQKTTLNAENSDDINQNTADLEKDITSDLLPSNQLKDINGLLIGFDKSNGLTDVIMVVHLDVATHQIKLISVPRDLHIDFEAQSFAQIRDKYKIGASFCKVTEVYGNIHDDDKAIFAVKDTVEQITGLKMDYLATININGFKEVVDVLGGIEFDVPQNMDYDDPAQDLSIHLDKGMQLIDGEKAEQLVRFRHYKMGDLQRIKVQQAFMVEMTKKIVNNRSWLQMTKLLTTLLGYFDTDFGLVELLSYTQYLIAYDLNEVVNSDNMMTIESFGEKINELWYQKWDVEGTPLTIQKFLESSPQINTTIND